MISICREEELIIREMFSGKASQSELEIIKRCVVEVKNEKGICSEIVRLGADLHSSTARISKIIGVNAAASELLSHVLWNLVRSRSERARMIKAGIDKGMWVYESYLCKHLDHAMLNGKVFSIRKGMRVRFFRRIHVGELIGCGCMVKPDMPV